MTRPSPDEARIDRTGKDPGGRSRKTLFHGLLLCLGIAALAGPALVEGMEYLRGQDIWLVPGFFLYPLVGLALRWFHYPVAAAIGLVGAAMLRSDKRRALGFLMAGALIGAVPTLVFPAPPSTPWFLKGYAAKVRRAYDLAALQEWATLVPARTDVPSDGLLGGEFESALLPATERVSPTFRFVSIVPAGPQGGRHVKLSRGGHFVDFWGLRVGPKNYECPTGEWQLAIAPGVCVWSQDEFSFSFTN